MLRTLTVVTFNSFLEDTSVLVATAFLIVRGPLERRLANPVWSGLIFGLLGMSEAFFPNDRFPYASHTLATAAASILIGWRGATLTAILSSAATLALRSPEAAFQVAVQVGIVVLFTAFMPRPKNHMAFVVAGTVVLSQSVAVFGARLMSSSQESMISLWTVPANTFGVLLLGLVLRDARERSQTEQHRQEVAEARRLATEAQLTALRARVKPHFLFNALNAIAALCEIAPKRAGRAATQLGALMRGSLEADFGKPHSLGRELETIRNYAGIELERFGPKLTIQFYVDGFEEVQVPTFGVQTLVENAILHGISRSRGNGQVTVIARKRGAFAVIAVADDGAGLTSEGWRRETPHGLNLLEAQLSSQIGSRGKLRVLARPSGGTLAVIRVPWEGAGAS